MNPTAHDPQDSLRQELLELYFDCHPSPAALRQRLEADPELQALYAEIEAMGGLLEDAAREGAPELDLAPPMTTTPSRRPRLLRYSLWAAALLLACFGGNYGWHWYQYDRVRSESLRLLVCAPPAIPDGAPLRFAVETRNLKREGLITQVAWKVFDARDELLAESTSLCTGSLDIQVPGNLKQPRKLQITATVPATGAVQRVTQTLRPAESAPLVHLSSDKPAYRPGETVRLRATCLDRVTLEATELGALFCRVTDGRGSEVFKTGLDVAQGVAARQWQIPAHSLGGIYHFEIRDTKNKLSLERLPFLVRNFQAPKLRKKIDLDRETYAAGSQGKAVVQLQRLQDQDRPAAGARVFASLIVDGEECWKERGEADAEGIARFEFQVPSIVDKGSARLVARVVDGGQTETILEPFVIPTDKIEARFSPEGGVLVDGVEGRVYLQLEDALGRPMSGAGHVVDSKGNKVCAVRTAHLGRARFAFTPKHGEKYQLALEEPRSKRFDLPAVQRLGVALRLDGDVVAAGAPVALRIQARRPGPFLAAVFCRGVVVGQRSLSPSLGEAVPLRIPLQAKASGVLRLTVFDHRLRPVAERLFQRQAKERIQVALKPVLAKAHPGAKQTIEVTTRNENGKPLAAVVGLSVYDKAVAAMVEYERNGIQDQQQLWADVERPDDKADELQGRGAEVAQRVDLLLGSLGWRRFAWLQQKSQAQLAKLGGDWAKSLPAREGRAMVPRIADTLAGSLAVLTQSRADHEHAWEVLLDGLAAVLGLGILLGLGLVFVRAKTQRSWASRSLWTAGLALPLFLLAALPLARLMESGWVAGTDFKSAPPPTASAMPLSRVLEESGIESRGLSEGSIQTRRESQALLLDFEVEIAQAAAVANPAVDSGAILGSQEGRPLAPILPPGRTRTMRGLGEPADARNSLSLLVQADAPAPGQDPALNGAFFLPPSGSLQAPAGYRIFRFTPPRAGNLPSDLDDINNGVFFNDGLDGDIRGRTENYFQWFTAGRGKYFPGGAGGGGGRFVMDYGDYLGYRAGQAGEVALPLLVDFATSGKPDDAKQIGRELSELSRVYKVRLDLTRANLAQTTFAFAHPGTGNGRQHLVETLFWKPMLLTDAKGKASVSFDLSDKLGTWTVAADAHGGGRVGQAEAEFSSSLPFALDLKVPTQLTEGDRVRLPLAFGAEDKASQLARVRVLSQGLQKLHSATSLQVPLEDGSGRTLIEVEALPTKGRGSLATLALQGRLGKAQDVLQRQYRILPRGFPHSMDQAGWLEGEVKLDLDIPDALALRTAVLELSFAPTPLASLEQGLDGLLREPGGCFEQVSSSNYPNIMALSLMDRGGDSIPAVETRAQDLLRKGYQKLVAYEVEGGGFEWWGKKPAHLALTAYGLMQFVDMARVYDGVDPQMVARTRAFILSKRDGRGGFVTGRGKYGHFMGGSAATRSSYITQALLYAGTPATELKDEIDALARRATATKDPYELALSALGLGLAEHQAASAARQRLLGMRHKDGSLQGLHSITASGPRDRAIETTALAMLAWMQDNGDAETQAAVLRGLRFLASQRQGRGSYGSTQATVLALKAVLAFARSDTTVLEPDTLQVEINGTQVASYQIRGSERRAIVFDDLAQHLRQGPNQLRMRLAKANRLPYLAHSSYRADLPRNHAAAPLRLETGLSRQSLVEGAVTTAELSLRNISDQPVPNPMILFGIPAGLHIDSKILEDLKKAETIAAWELNDRQLVLYFRGLKAGEARQIQISCSGRLPGTTTGPASVAYPYYSPRQKHWARPLQVSVR